MIMVTTDREAELQLKRSDKHQAVFRNPEMSSTHESGGDNTAAMVRCRGTSQRAISNSAASASPVNLCAYCYTSLLLIPWL